MKRNQTFRQRLNHAINYPGREFFHCPVLAAKSELSRILLKASVHIQTYPSPRAVFDQ